MTLPDSQSVPHLSERIVTAPLLQYISSSSSGCACGGASVGPCGAVADDPAALPRRNEPDGPVQWLIQAAASLLQAGPLLRRMLRRRRPASAYETGEKPSGIGRFRLPTTTPLATLKYVTELLKRCISSRRCRERGDWKQAGAAASTASKSAYEQIASAYRPVAELDLARIEEPGIP